MSLSQGARLGSYEILSPLGAGGMGEVFRARDARLNRDVAVKVLPESLAKDADALSRFEREALAVAALSHPGILSIFDFGADGGVRYAVTELLEGETLRQKLADGPLPPRRAVELGAQIARALAAAHEKGIVHRDLKPENLFVTRDGRAKILDFGLAKQANEKLRPDSFLATAEASPAHGTEPGMILGTIGYMSPEQVRGEKVDARSDIFSFGAVFFEMLTGKKAFLRATSSDTLAAILRDDPPDMESGSRPVPPGLVRIVQHCLEKEPEQRFRDAHDLAFALESLSLTTAREAPFTAPFAPQNRSTTWKWGALGASALLGALALGWALRGGAPPGPRFQRLTFQRGTMENARFAPDGTTIVYSARWQGRPPALYAIHPGSPESQPLGAGEASLLAVSPANELAVQLSSTLSYGVYVGDLARMPMGGGGARAIEGTVREADWDPKSGELALTTVANSQWRIESPPRKVAYSARYIGNIRFARTGGAIAFAERGGGFGWSPLPEPADICVLDAAGKKSVLAREKRCTGIAWSPKGDEVWFSESLGGNETVIWGVTLSGKARRIWSGPGNIALLDVAPDGKALTSTLQLQDGVVCLVPGEQRERDVSVFDGSGAADLSPDGKTLLLNERGAGGGPLGTIFLCPLDGSPPTKLAEGHAYSFSSDGAFVLAALPNDPSHLFLVPTGTGESRKLDIPGFTSTQMAWFRPGTRKVVFQGMPTSRAVGLFEVDVERPGPPRELAAPGTLEWMGVSPLSPDGRSLLTYRDLENGPLEQIQPLDGGTPSTVPFERQDVPIRWTADGRGMYVFKRQGIPARVYRMDPATGKKELVKEFMPADPGGMTGFMTVTMTADAKTFVFSYRRRLSELYLVQGLK